MDEIPQPTPPTQSKYHTWEFALGISVLMLLMVGVVYLVEGQMQPSTEVEPTPIVADETANWKTYKNEFYNYEIRYPGNFILHTASNYSPLVSFELAPSEQAKSVLFERFRIQSDYSLASSTLDGQGNYYEEPISIGELFLQLSKEEGAEIKEVSLNGLVGFQITRSIDLMGMEGYKGLFTEVYLAKKMDDTEFFYLDAGIGNFKNEEEKQSLLPSLESFNSVVSTFQLRQTIYGDSGGSVSVPYEYVKHVDHSKVSFASDDVPPEQTYIRTVNIEGDTWREYSFSDAGCESRRFYRDLYGIYDLRFRTIMVRFSSCEGDAVSLPSEDVMLEILGTFILG